jgi:hypothetical protein
MKDFGWYFAPLCGGQQIGLADNNREDFKGKDLINNSVREFVQNSLDMRVNPNIPVKVDFNLKYLKPKEYPEIFMDFLFYLKNSKKPWTTVSKDHKDYIKTGTECVNKDNVPFLIISDHNTKGARGSMDINNTNTSWAALVNIEGHSVKPEDEDDEDDVSGGSFGIGKNAAYACSALNMVFYHTTAIDTATSLIGLVKLCTTKNADGENTQPTGKFCFLGDPINHPYGAVITEKHENKFRDLFLRKRDDYGTDVIIAAFNELDNWMEHVKQAILRNFFVAIAENKLIVEIKDGENCIIIDKTNIAEYFSEY